MNDWPDIRAAVAKLCTGFPGEYWRAKDKSSDYPIEFVEALTREGWLSALIPEEFGGSGLPLSAACAILEEIHASGGEPDRAQRLAPQVPMQRPGSAQEVANAIMWLLSPQASYCTGTLLDVGGGR